MDFFEATVLTDCENNGAPSMEPPKSKDSVSVFEYEVQTVPSTEPARTSENGNNPTPSTASTSVFEYEMRTVSSTEPAFMVEHENKDTEPALVFESVAVPSTGSGLNFKTLHKKMREMVMQDVKKHFNEYLVKQFLLFFMTEMTAEEYEPCEVQITAASMRHPHPL